jgi:ATP-binding cassette subfamily F protein 3
LFTGQEVFKKVKVLSGGEKSRLALAKTLITQSNFLLLDEPTNHLDMFSTSVLAEALENYEGSIIFVSHDRTFISRVANKIWWIENGELKEYLGSFDEFNEWNATRVVEVKPIVKTPTPVVQASTTAQTVESPSKKTLSKNQIQKLEQDMQQFESEIKLLEKKNAELSVMMQDPSVATDSNKLMEVTSQHKQNDDAISALQKQYDEVMETWLSTQE